MKFIIKVLNQSFFNKSIISHHSIFNILESRSTFSLLYATHKLILLTHIKSFEFFKEKILFEVLSTFSKNKSDFISLLFCIQEDSIILDFILIQNQVWFNKLLKSIAKDKENITILIFLIFCFLLYSLIIFIILKLYIKHYYFNHIL